MNSNALNAALAPALGPIRIWIDPKCKGLIHDLENVSWEPGTRKLAKGDDSLTHFTDALRYVIAQELPCTGPTVSTANEPRGLRVLA